MNKYIKIKYCEFLIFLMMLLRGWCLKRVERSKANEYNNLRMVCELGELTSKLKNKIKGFKNA